MADPRVHELQALLPRRLRPGDYPPTRECAKKLVAAALFGEVECDWREIQRLAENNAYKNRL
jgi:hypothetical protein